MVYYEIEAHSSYVNKVVFDAYEDVLYDLGFNRGLNPVAPRN